MGHPGVPSDGTVLKEPPSRVVKGILGVNSLTLVARTTLSRTGLPGPLSRTNGQNVVRKTVGQQR